jgi:hypothetical protein
MTLGSGKWSRPKTQLCRSSTLLETSGEAGDPTAGLASRFFEEMQALIETPW